MELRVRLHDIGDERLEERGRRWNRAHFVLVTLWADKRGIFSDVIGYKPWWQPFKLGRLTAAAFVTSLLSFLGAEVWELGVGMDGRLLAVGGVVSVLSATW